MKRLFPPMYDRPENWMPAAALAYWVFAFPIIPTFLSLISDGLWGELEYNSWLDIVYHAINAGVMAAMFRTYAVESFLNVQLDTKKFFKTVGIALLVMLTIALRLYFIPVPMVVDAYPINEMFLSITAGLMVDQLPVYGTLCHVLITPIAVVGLFYVPVFAPMCCRKTWLGYLSLTVMLAIPTALDILWRGQAELAIPIFLLNLPMHLVACWTYQKADTVWAPLATLATFNLVTSVISIYLL